jgi:hypothetical protein
MVKSTKDTNTKDSKPAKTRPEGRPYKKLTSDVLLMRKSDIQKKLDMHAAKSTLLSQRLEQYEREETLRNVVQSGSEDVNEA